MFRQEIQPGRERSVVDRRPRLRCPFPDGRRPFQIFMTAPDYTLRERIEAVSNASGTENDLLTVAVPPENPIGETLERVEEDHAEAEYIDADETSKAHRAVLERAQHVLHGYDETPDNGLVLYVGALSGENGVTEYAFDDLSGPVREEVYEWSNEFDVEALETATEASSTYGLLVVERGGAALGTRRGDGIEVIETVESDVMGKTKAGGQSAERFARDRERQKEEFFEEVAGEAKRAFLDGDEPTVDGLLVGGTTVTADEFTGGDYLDHRLQSQIVGGAFSVEYASEQGLRQLVERGRDAMADAEQESVRAALDRFREGLRADEGDEVVYGDDAVERALEYDAVETLLVSNALSVEAIETYEERTDDEGGDVVVVPSDAETGARFDETFGVAAILRFPVD
jgi:peptide chain release factor subunit 1